MISGKVFTQVDLQDHELKSRDSATTGYEFSQTRGVLAIDTSGSDAGDVGIVAVIPVGMSHVASVNLTAVAGRKPARAATPSCSRCPRWPGTPTRRGKPCGRCREDPERQHRQGRRRCCVGRRRIRRARTRRPQPHRNTAPTPKPVRRPHRSLAEDHWTYPSRRRKHPDRSTRASGITTSTPATTPPSAGAAAGGLRQRTGSSG